MAFGIYSSLSDTQPKRVDEAFIHPANMPVMQGDLGYLEKYKNELTFIGPAIETVHSRAPSGRETRRRGFVASMAHESISPEGARSRVESSYSIATLQKVGHPQVSEIAKALADYHDNNLHREAPPPVQTPAARRAQTAQLRTHHSHNPAAKAQAATSARTPVKAETKTAAAPKSVDFFSMMNPGTSV